MTEEITRKKRRSIAKVYDLPYGNISVRFPYFVSELFAVANHYKTDSVKELISMLQGMCLSEGLRPDWSKLTSKEAYKIAASLKKRDKELRAVQRKEGLEKDKKNLFADFPTRVKKTREGMGDF